MGMFDSFHAKTKCPYCGEEKEFEFQTKALNSSMKSWSIGEKITSKYMLILDVRISGCIASHCCPGVKTIHEWDKKRYKKVRTLLKSHGFGKKQLAELRDIFSSHEGRHFYGDVVIENGIFVRIDNIRKTE